MNCPYCGSNKLEESSNFNEFICQLCKCEFKQDGDKHQIFEDGNYKKFCENVMYKLCETCSPQVSNVLVSVISQLKNNGVEEIDTILEHLLLVSANLSSEIALGLKQASDLDVVNEGINYFNTIGNTLLKRDDLELNLSRFNRFNESKIFYEKNYGVKSIGEGGPLAKIKVTPSGGGKTKEVVAGAVDEGIEDWQTDPSKSTVDELPTAPMASASDGTDKWENAKQDIMNQHFNNQGDMLQYLAKLGMSIDDFEPHAAPEVAQLWASLPEEPYSARPGGGLGGVGGLADIDDPTFNDPVDPTLDTESALGMPGEIGTQLPGELDPEVQADLAAARDADVGEMGALPLPPDIGGEDPLAGSVGSPDPRCMACHGTGWKVGQNGEEKGECTCDVDGPQPGEGIGGVWETVNAIAEGYVSGKIPSKADFITILSKVCDDPTKISEEQVYKIAELVEAKVKEMTTQVDIVPHPTKPGEFKDKITKKIGPEDMAKEEPPIIEEAEVTPAQLQEAIEILASSLNLNEEELKDL